METSIPYIRQVRLQASQHLIFHFQTSDLLSLLTLTNTSYLENMESLKLDVAALVP